MCVCVCARARARARVCVCVSERAGEQGPPAIAVAHCRPKRQRCATCGSAGYTGNIHPLHRSDPSPIRPIPSSPERDAGDTRSFQVYSLLLDAVGNAWASKKTLLTIAICKQPVAGQFVLQLLLLLLVSLLLLLLLLLVLFFL